jgi:peptide-methionine (S)-S-oxide reductase
MVKELDVAVLAGGCFWCLEPVFSQLNGVEKVVSGYTGGHTLQPDYKQVCRGDTGHAEAIRISFDPARISFYELLEIFFLSHDPTTPNRQGNDIGTQYRSAIFCQNAAQRSTAEQMIAELNQLHVFASAIVTEVNDAAVFYAAEDYHQQYYEQHQEQPYCMLVAAPKVAKIRAKFPEKIRN